MRDREPDMERYEAHARQTTYGNVTAPPISKLSPSGVLFQLEVLEKLTAEAHSLMDRLGARLEPITEAGPEAPRGGSPVRERDAVESTQVGQRLEALSMTVRDLCARIDSQHTRIRL